MNCTIRKILAGFILLLPFICLFTWIALDSSVLVALQVFGMTLLIVGGVLLCVTVAFNLKDC